MLQPTISNFLIVTYIVFENYVCADVISPSILWAGKLSEKARMTNETE
jgi:hypothetical protein